MFPGHRTTPEPGVLHWSSVNIYAVKVNEASHCHSWEKSSYPLTWNGPGLKEQPIVIQMGGCQLQEQKHMVPPVNLIVSGASLCTLPSGASPILKLRNGWFIISSSICTKCLGLLITVLEICLN